MATDIVSPQVVMLAKQAVILLEEGRWEEARELFREVIRRVEAAETRAILQRRPVNEEG